MTLTSAEGLESEQARPRGPGRGRHIVVIALGAILVVVACGIMSVAFAQGSWWYSYGTDRALNEGTRTRVEAIRDEVEASGAAPEAVVWLNAALEPNAHPTDIRAYLLAAQEVLETVGDPQLAEAARELQAIIETIRPPNFRMEMRVTPYPVSTLEWP